MTHSPNLSHGRGYLAIPGPSVMPDAVLQAMHRPAPNIYSGALVEMMPALMADLKRVRATRHHAAIYIGNGHAAWEAALCNVIAPGERVLVPATGRFGIGWGEMATGIGADVQVIDFGKSTPMDLEVIAQALAADKDHRIKAVLAVHVDTSSSVLNDIGGLRGVLDAAGHPALLMADCIASLGCDRFEMDDWGVDVMVTGCQKGLMVPPGCAFVFFNDRAQAVRDAMPRVSRYWDWTPRSTATEFYQYFNGTAPTHHLFGLRAALDLIHAEGIEAVWARHTVLARAIWAACDAWGAGGDLRLNVADPACRSTAVTSLRLGGHDGTRLRDWVESQLGLTLGIGLGMAEVGDPARDAYFRLGHMGHVSGHMIMGLLGGMQAGMAHLGIAHGRGALDAAADVIAGQT
jgi:alanine-glyoxylate transaminase/serine-glyoxylate transaminase/serine-pyruvate transaminase